MGSQFSLFPQGPNFHYFRGVPIFVILWGPIFVISVGPIFRYFCGIPSFVIFVGGPFFVVFVGSQFLLFSRESQFSLFTSGPNLHYFHPEIKSCEYVYMYIVLIGSVRRLRSKHGTPVTRFRNHKY